ncbi:hypothetical protein, variant 1 [Aphanomyces invadans]|uniref:IPT/TIG domain-containing protein n=1 Tax=Aphanomyces invadans TaxID=157072 RepID=A0A024UCQ7_9STRA|nr:hypothetical protein, variant 1 [Aphanomyces invadans]ETW03677.1 hypothetical protein, variant 1 [Aphanomyces invadans]|eukprot:XP_008867906.1 hypothetical protein, variant 1 [Aphanomyces invadans]
MVRWSMGRAVVCVLAGLMGCPNAESVTMDHPSSAVFWPSTLGDVLTIDGQGVRSTGDMTIVFDSNISLANKTRWHPSMDQVDVSVVTLPGRSNSKVWTEFISRTVKTLHDSAGVHVRVHHHGSSSELLEIQRHVSVLLTSIFGLSNNFSADEPIAFPSTMVYANASCDVPAYVGGPNSHSSSSFCLVSSRPVSHIATPTLFASLVQHLPQSESLVQRQLAKIGGIERGDSKTWHPRAIHFSLDKSLSMHIQEVVMSSSSTSKLEPTAVRITSQALAEESHVVEAIKQGAASIVAVTTAKQVAVVQSHGVGIVRQASSRMAGAGFHQVLQVTVEAAVPTKTSAATCAVLVTQVFPTTAYADMDELRRMERFHSFDRVVSFAKHIEIERPSALSSQHVVSFVVSLQNSTTTIEIPVHFRYQFPSNATLYRPVHLMAPSLHIHCEKTPSSTIVSHPELSGKSWSALVVEDSMYWTRYAERSRSHQRRED